MNTLRVDKHRLDRIEEKVDTSFTLFQSQPPVELCQTADLAIIPILRGNREAGRQRC